jgi:3'-phosphoadenosine 5'-phosphosulfate sulfotransferase (PAPS reductase)/FAD synthetase
MKYTLAIIAALVGAASAFAPSSKSAFKPSSGLKMAFDQEQFIAETKEMRMKHLEEQAMYALKTSCEGYENAVFPNAMIAGDVVITHLLHRLGYLESGKAKVMVVDTFHLFPETMTFLKEIEKAYKFKAEIFCAEGIPTGDKAAFDKRYGADLWKENIDEYDRVCKVEPFQRGLKTLKTDCMINGRTRWQGVERAWIDMFENAPIGGGLAKCNPIVSFCCQRGGASLIALARDFFECLILAFVTHLGLLDFGGYL